MKTIPLSKTLFDYSEVVISLVTDKLFNLFQLWPLFIPRGGILLRVTGSALSSSHLALTLPVRPAGCCKGCQRQQALSHLRQQVKEYQRRGALPRDGGEIFANVSQLDVRCHRIHHSFPAQDPTYVTGVKTRLKEKPAL